MNDFVKQPYKFGFPEKRGLYDPAMEKDSCGVGFVANIKGIPSHEIMLAAYHLNSRMIEEDAVLNLILATAPEF